MRDTILGRHIAGELQVCVTTGCEGGLESDMAVSGDLQVCVGSSLEEAIRIFNTSFDLWTEAGVYAGVPKVEEEPIVVLLVSVRGHVCFV